ncbi:MAG: hypothetical protein JWL77_545 [Chthonomonadaceae bacterium]|nr:hypothetical protein [Chthonomonadaceae bacterium]
MKQKVNPAMAVSAIVILVLVAGLFIWKAGAGTPRADGEKPPGMPADAAKDFQQRMGGAAGPSGATGPGSATAGPPGAPGGYIMPPPH